MTNRNVIKNFGYVSRMDNLQAAILNFRIKKINKIISQRRKNVKLYFKYLNNRNIYIPKEKKEEFNTYHTFVVQVESRDKLRTYLKNRGIMTSIHYPIPIHKQPAYKKMINKVSTYKNTEDQAEKILTLPIHQYLKKKEIMFISKNINKFYEETK